MLHKCPPFTHEITLTHPRSPIFVLRYVPHKVSVPHVKVDNMATICGCDKIDW